MEGGTQEIIILLQEKYKKIDEINLYAKKLAYIESFMPPKINNKIGDIIEYFNTLLYSNNNTRSNFILKFILESILSELRNLNTEIRNIDYEIQKENDSLDKDQIYKLLKTQLAKEPNRTDLKDKIAAKEQQLNKLKKTKENIENEIQQLKKKKISLENEIDITNKTMASMQEQINKLTKDLTHGTLSQTGGAKNYKYKYLKYISKIKHMDK
jgi:chromosome segregation ATPase